MRGAAFKVLKLHHEWSEFFRVFIQKLPLKENLPAMKKNIGCGEQATLNKNKMNPAGNKINLYSLT